VSIGPISIIKAEKLLDWKPTNLFLMLEEYVKFYNDIDLKFKFKTEFEEMLEDLPKKIKEYIQNKEIEKLI